MDTSLDGVAAPKKKSRLKASGLKMPAERSRAAVSLDSIYWAQSAHEHMVGTRHERISIVAYLKAEARGFAAGYEADDWLAAQLEVDVQESFKYR